MIPTKQPDYTANWEGFVPRLYICPAGFPTIGYGHRVGTWSLQDTGSTASGTPTCGRLLRSMIADDTGQWMSEQAALALLQDDLEQCAERLIRLMGSDAFSKIITHHVEDPEAPPRQVVLLDWCLNTGGGSMPGFLAAVKAADWQLAHDELIYVDGKAVSAARKKLIASGVPEPHAIYAGIDTKTAYWKVRPERADLNAKVILTGEWPT